MPSRTTVAEARYLRRELTPPEVRLWAVLRSRPGDMKFRRQHPVGPYVLDFYCASAKVAIEIDGMVHDMGDAPYRDMVRDKWLREQGIRILRIPAREVMNDLDATVRMILNASAFPLHQPAAGPPPHASMGRILA